MGDSFKAAVEELSTELAVIRTDGYINLIGAEKLQQLTKALFERGYRKLLINLAGTKVINSIGLSILVEIIEEGLEIDARVAFCNLTLTIESTINIMGLDLYSKTFPTEEDALEIIDRWKWEGDDLVKENIERQRRITRMKNLHARRQAVEPIVLRLRVFLCHASRDKSMARKLYLVLKNKNLDPWLDEENLLAGQEWRAEIYQAIKDSDAVIVLLSSRSTTKAGFVQREIGFALDILAEKPEGTIFLVPVRLGDCTVPHRLEHLHYIDLFSNDGERRLLEALSARSQQLGKQPCQLVQEQA